MADETMKVKDLISDIKTNLKQKNCSRRDEIAVMQSMLSDPTYEVAVYGKDGTTGTYNPCKDFRSMCSSIIVGTTKISKAEADGLLENYVPKKSDAESMINVSKEFVNTYLQTGRKMSMGGRETSDIYISQKSVPEVQRDCPKRDEKGNYVRVPTKIPAHGSFKVQASCPSWVK